MEQRMGRVDGLEKLTFGSALFEAAYRSRGIEPMPQFDRNRLPQLSEALRANHLDGEALFIATVRQYLDGFASVAPKAPADRAKAKAKKPAVKAPAKKGTAARKSKRLNS